VYTGPSSNMMMMMMTIAHLLRSRLSDRRHSEGDDGPILDVQAIGPDAQTGRQLLSVRSPLSSHPGRRQMHGVAIKLFHWLAVSHKSVVYFTRQRSNTPDMR